MIPGTVIGLQGGASLFGVYRANYGTNNNAGNFSFPDSDIGTPAPGRVIAIVVNYWEFDTTVNLNSLTVGGTALTQRITAANLVSGASGSYVYSAIWSAVISTGSTATIDIGFSRGIERGCQVGIWSIYNAQSATPVLTTSGVSGGVNPINLSVNVQPNDFGIVGATGAYGTNTAQFSYTNATERYDTRSTGVGVQDIARSGADFLALAAQSPRTVTVTPANVSDGSAAVLAVWR
jgi:hypothetical protein